MSDADPKPTRRFGGATMDNMPWWGFLLLGGSVGIGGGGFVGSRVNGASVEAAVDRLRVEVTGELKATRVLVEQLGARLAIVESEARTTAEQRWSRRDHDQYAAQRDALARDVEARLRAVEGRLQVVESKLSKQ